MLTNNIEIVAPPNELIVKGATYVKSAACFAKSIVTIGYAANAPKMPVPITSPR